MERQIPVLLIAPLLLVGSAFAAVFSEASSDAYQPILFLNTIVLYILLLSSLST